MKRMILILSAVLLVLSICGCASDPDEKTSDTNIPENESINEEEAKQAAIEYMANVKPWLDEKQKTIRNQESKKIEVAYMENGLFADGMRFISNATEVSYVKSIPKDLKPIVYIGKDMVATREKFYHSTPNGILAFILSKPCSFGFILRLEWDINKDKYPEVIEGIAEGVIKQIKSEMVYEDKDILYFRDGYLSAIDIKTEKTAEMVFECIRNSVRMIDHTNMASKPSAPAFAYTVSNYSIGESRGDLVSFFCRYKETGQTVGIYFSEEDTQVLKEYCESLAEQNPD